VPALLNLQDFRGEAKAYQVRQFLNWRALADIDQDLTTEGLRGRAGAAPRAALTSLGLERPPQRPLPRIREPLTTAGDGGQEVAPHSGDDALVPITALYGRRPLI
jgi:hypothetical protein